jgi:predicted naringenin-chalcone synthase
MNATIQSIGLANPETILTREDGLGLARVLCSRTAEQSTWLPAMYDGTRIRTRRTVLDRQVVRDVLEATCISQSVYLPKADPADRGPTTEQRMAIYAEHAGPLALKAAIRAINDARIDRASITHLITISCTGFNAPGVDVELLDGLSLPADTQRTHIGYMGCHGLINGLRVARAYAESGGRVLLCAVELCSLHYHYGWDPAKVIANALFSDGAAALMVGPAKEAGWRIAATGSYLFPGSTADMSWTMGDHGFEMSLSKRVPMLIQENLGNWLDGWLAKHGLSRSAIGCWAIHPGGPKILEAVASALRLPDEGVRPSWEILAEFGNMSSPTLGFILQRLQQSGARPPCVMLGFGPGLVVEAALLRE